MAAAQLLAELLAEQLPSDAADLSRSLWLAGEDYPEVGVTVSTLRYENRAHLFRVACAPGCAERFEQRYSQFNGYVRWARKTFDHRPDGELVFVFDYCTPLREWPCERRSLRERLLVMFAVAAALRRGYRECQVWPLPLNDGLVRVLPHQGGTGLHIHESHHVDIFFPFWLPDEHADLRNDASTLWDLAVHDGIPPDVQELWHGMLHWASGRAVENDDVPRKCCQAVEEQLFLASQNAVGEPDVTLAMPNYDEPDRTLNGHYVGASADVCRRPADFPNALPSAASTQTRDEHLATCRAWFEAVRTRREDSVRVLHRALGLNIALDPGRTAYLNGECSLLHLAVVIGHEGLVAKGLECFQGDPVRMLGKYDCGTEHVVGTAAQCAVFYLTRMTSWDEAHRKRVANCWRLLKDREANPKTETRICIELKFVNAEAHGSDVIEHAEHCLHSKFWPTGASIARFRCNAHSYPDARTLPVDLLSTVQGGLLIMNRFCPQAIDDFRTLVFPAIVEAYEIATVFCAGRATLFCTGRFQLDGSMAGSWERRGEGADELLILNWDPRTNEDYWPAQTRHRYDSNLRRHVDA